MKKILILGAGQSTPYLITYLLEEAAQNNWFVKVADRSLSLAQSRVKDHSKGLAVDIDINDRALRKTEISQADIVVNFLPPKFQYDIALECIEFGKHMITASYEDAQVALLDKEARCKGLLILNEMGLDPGIDHMSALSIIHKIRREDGYVNKFSSYGSGLPAPEVYSNPLRYCITWNPRNIVMAGEQGAHYMENGKVKLLNHNNIFQRTWNVMIDGIGELEAYPNRDAMKYQKLFRVNKVKTMIRGTLRYPGWCETWSQIVKLGMTNENIEIHHLKNKTYSEFTEMFLPVHISGGSVEARVANYLNISPTGKIMENLRWLGLFSENIINNNVVTGADVLVKLLNEKLQLPEGDRDVVILHHEIEAVYPGREKKEKTISTLVEFGKPYEHTAIAKTVGLPAAIAVKLVLSGQLPMLGCVQPVHAAIYEPVLSELKKKGIVFKEKTIQLK
jgi:saccharopine dehydrogenase-like NADP-dependent oxidoreductase